MLSCDRCIGVCCTAGGAVVVTPEDIARLADGFGVDEAEFRNKYISIENGNLILKSKWDPCPFLSKGRCSVYQIRPALCREYYCWNNQGGLDFRVAVAVQQQGIDRGQVMVRESVSGVAEVYLVEPVE